MHELSTAQDILERALTEAQSRGARRLGALHLKVGRKSYVEPNSLGFWLEALAEGTMAEGMKVDIKPVARVVRCLGCEAVFPLHNARRRCPRCGEKVVVHGAATGVYLESLEVE